MTGYSASAETRTSVSFEGSNDSEGIFTRYDKLDTAFAGCVLFVMILIL